MATGGKVRRGSSQVARTVRSLLFISALGAGLAIYNSVTVARDIATVTGPKGESQHEFFIEAADRPDIELFFKGLTHKNKMAMAERIGAYNDPKLATLIGKLLGTFDADARQVLTRSLTTIGEAHPDAVAGQLPRPGSLQQLAVTAALRSIGEQALPAVVVELKDKDARPNAVAYLVSAGKASVPHLLPLLDGSDTDVRLAAADALGKIGSREAVAKLTSLYEGAKGEERFAYLSALSGIGAPETEPLLTAAADDASLTTPQKAQAMLGLGRIGTPTAIKKLWSMSSPDDPQIRESVISALQLSGPGALEGAPNPTDALRVASGITDAAADRYIATALKNPTLAAPAARAASNRITLVSALLAAVKSNPGDGEATDAIMRALGTTQQGIEELRKLTTDPTLGGFAFRRLKLLGLIV